MSFWKWIQRFGSLPIYKRNRVSAFIIDETVIQIGNQHFWLWITSELIYRSVLGNTHFRRKKNVCSRVFLSISLEKYGRHIVLTDGGTWYDEAFSVLKLKHYLYSSIEKVWWNKSTSTSTENWGFDDYNPCRKQKEEYALFHVLNWIHFFVSIYKDKTIENYFIIKLN